MTSANKQKPQKAKDWTDVLKEEPVDNSRQAIEDVFENLHDLIIRKNTDYGNSAFDPPVLNPNATAENAILTRLSDKFSRLRHILQKGALVADETVEAIAFFSLPTERRRKWTMNEMIEMPYWQYLCTIANVAIIVFIWTLGNFGN